MKTNHKLFMAGCMMLCLLSCTGKGGMQTFEPTEPEEKPETPDQPDAPDVPAGADFVNCSYIRGDFYELGRVQAAAMNACTDLIYLEARPYANGDLTFDLPHNDMALGSAARHQAEFKGHRGVVHLDGTGRIDCGEGLLDSPRFEKEKGYSQFSIGTYIYLEEWTAGAILFEKQNGGSLLRLQLDNAEGSLKVLLGNAAGGAVFSHTQLSAGAWHHLTFTFNGGNPTPCQLYVDGEAYADRSGKPCTARYFPNDRGRCYMGGAAHPGGKGLKGYLDETYISGVDTGGRLGKTPIQFDNWNATKVLAYWKYDDAEHPGRDCHSWLTRLDNIHSDLSGNTATTLRLGIGGGRSDSWKQMAADREARINFARNVKKLLQRHHFAGVDLDLEWAYTLQELADYSATIVTLREVLGNDYILTASLHPVSYRISEDAIAALNYITLQCYGPQPKWLPMEAFVACGEEVVAYGIPKDKLVMGVPFYGTSGKHEEAYRTLFAHIASTKENEVIYHGDTYYFDNLTRMQYKVNYICKMGYRGVMSWDLANDLEYGHESSLLRCVNETVDEWRGRRQW